MKSFNKRFDCEIELIPFAEFKDGVITLIFETLGEKIIDNDLEMEFLKQIGKGADNFKLTLRKGIDLSLGFDEKTIYGKQTVIGRNFMECNEDMKFILFLEKFINLKNLSSGDKKIIISGICKVIKKCKYPIKLIQGKRDVFFLPSNSSELDSQVDKTWHWLDKYPSIKKDFTYALKNFSYSARDSINYMRISLENLIKKVTKKDSTSKIKENLIEYLNSKKVTPEIINSFTTIFSYLEDFQNNYVKHNNPKCPEHVFIDNETTFLLYQYTNFINFIVSLEDC